MKMNRHRHMKTMAYLENCGEHCEIVIEYGGWSERKHSFGTEI